VPQPRPAIGGRHRRGCRSAGAHTCG
jgi:hypothetical protein